MSHDAEPSSIELGLPERAMRWLLQLPGWTYLASGLSGLILALAFSLR